MARIACSWRVSQWRALRSSAFFISNRLGRCRHSCAFTLIELLAVVLMILVLAAIGLGVSGFVQKKVAVSTARAQMSALETALESYKADWGYYPATQQPRISNNGVWESVNNSILYRALSGANGGKRYMQFSPGQLRVNIASGSTNSTLTAGTASAAGGLTNICDPWGMPLNYYCSPATAYGVSNAIPAAWPPLTFYRNGYAVGGQVNVATYDLSSYGPDGSTYVPGAIPYGGGYNYAWLIGNSFDRWTNTVKSLDDITNWQP